MQRWKNQQQVSKYGGSYHDCRNDTTETLLQSAKLCAMYIQSCMHTALKAAAGTHCGDTWLARYSRRAGATKEIRKSGGNSLLNLNNSGSCHFVEPWTDPALLDVVHRSWCQHQEWAAGIYTPHMGWAT